MARHIFRHLCASRSDTMSSTAFRNSEMSSRVTVRGSQSPNTGLIRFQPRHQSSRVRGFFLAHSSVRL
jgi:hypothetical protein